MEKTICRFDKYRAHKGLSDNQVTIDLNLSVGLLGKSRKPDRDLSKKTIEKVLNFYTDLNRRWLLFGEGEMLKSPQLPGTTRVFPNKSIANEGISPYENGGPCSASECVAERERLNTRIKNLEERLKDKNELLEFYRQRDKKENRTSTGT